MEIHNKTAYDLAPLFSAALEDFDHEGLLVEVKYSPAGSGRYISGTYYREAPDFPQGKLIRLRINRTNEYPLKVAFKTSDYFTRRDKKGREVIYQKMRYEEFVSAEHLALAIFLHEFSHYIDHMEGRNGRYKQTKADKFSMERMKAMGLVK